MIGCGDSSPMPAPPADPSGNPRPCSQTPPNQPVTSDPSNDNFIEFPLLGIGMKKPDGFEVATNFVGFKNDKESSTVIIGSIKAPVENVIRRISKGEGPLFGDEILEYEEVKVGDGPAALVFSSKTINDVPFHKWILVFGNQGQTMRITALYPQDRQAILSTSLRETILTVRPVP